MKKNSKTIPETILEKIEQKQILEKNEIFYLLKNAIIEMERTRYESTNNR